MENCRWTPPWEFANERIAAFGASLPPTEPARSSVALLPRGGHPLWGFSASALAPSALLRSLSCSLSHQKSRRVPSPLSRLEKSTEVIDGPKEGSTGSKRDHSAQIKLASTKAARAELGEALDELRRTFVRRALAQR